MHEAVSEGRTMDALKVVFICTDRETIKLSYNVAKVVINHFIYFILLFFLIITSFQILIWLYR